MTARRTAALLLLCCAAAGCAARRTLVMRSTPPGAVVEVDGQRIGETPVELEFQHYGARQVSMTLPGYATWTKVVRVRPPWYGRFPFDLVSEILLPLGWHDVHRIHGELAPAEGKVEDPDLQAVLARARALRAIMDDAHRRGSAPPPTARKGLARELDQPSKPPPDPNSVSGSDEDDGS